MLPSSARASRFTTASTLANEAEPVDDSREADRPGVSRTMRQVHARKNHSYFLVFWKQGGSKGLWEPPR